MAVHTLEASMADLMMPGGSILKLEAINPTTGAAVTGVKVTNVAVYGNDVSDDAGNLDSGPFVLVPGPGAGGDTA